MVCSLVRIANQWYVLPWSSSFPFQGVMISVSLTMWICSLTTSSTMWLSSKELVVYMKATEIAQMIFEQLTHQEPGCPVPTTDYVKWARQKANNIAAAMIGVTVK
jgi:hypothetical protein